MQRNELPAEIVSLEDALKKLRERRAAHLEALALGKPVDEYHVLVGRAKEDAWLIDVIARRVLQVRADGGE